MVGAVRKGMHLELPSVLLGRAGKLVRTSSDDRGALTLRPPTEGDALYCSSDSHQHDTKLKTHENIKHMKEQTCV